jgi:uncharacterized protein YuzE
MRADYDSQADTIQIELVPGIERLDYDEVVEDGAVIVGFREERPVLIDVVGTRTDIDEPLRIAAERHGLDAEALIAAAQAAVAAPDRPVTLDVGVRAAA